MHPGVQAGSDSRTGPVPATSNDIATAMVRRLAVVESKVRSYRMLEIGADRSGAGAAFCCATMRGGKTASQSEVRTPPRKELQRI
jgi:hypothetical protein